MVSVQINLGGPFENDVADVTAFARGTPELSALLSLGEYLATGGPFIVKKIRVDKDFNQAYIGVYWTCDIDDLRFVMHRTLAKWDPTLWLTNATFGFDNSVAVAALMSIPKQWMIATSPELMSIGEMQMSVIIGQPKQSGRGWRVIMKMRNNAFAMRLRILRNDLEDVLAVSLFNMSGELRGELHFSLDRCWGIMPPAMMQY